MKLWYCDTKYAEHKSTGCQFFSVWKNALIYYGLAAHICSPWSKLRAFTVWAGSSVKYTFHSEQSNSCRFIAYRNQLTKHMHKGNSGHNLSHQKVICSQTCCQHNRAFFLFSFHRITVSYLKKKKRRKIVVGRSIFCDSYTYWFQWPFH